MIGRAGKLDDMPLFGGPQPGSSTSPSTSGGLGGPPSSKQGQQKMSMDDVPLVSEVGLGDGGAHMRGNRA